MRRPGAVTVLLVVLLGSASALAKRAGPPDVKPVLIGGLRIEAVHWGRERGLGQNGGIIEAFDPSSGKSLWTLEVYDVHYDPAMEEDVQDVFIASLTAAPSQKTVLQVTDERGLSYEVDVAERSVRRLVTFAPWRASVTVVRGRAARVRLSAKTTAGVPMGDEVELSASMAASLTGLLRNPDLYNDRVVKRCAKDVLVAFRLITQREGEAESPTDLVIDFKCNSIDVSTGKAPNQTHYAAFFDEGRARFLELAEQLFPGDKALRRLRR